MRAGPAVDAQGRGGGGRADRVAAQCGRGPHVARVVAHAVLAGQVHDVRPASEEPDGVPAAQRLAVGDEVGRDAVVLLGPAVREAEPGDDLIEDEQHAVAGAGFAEPLEESGLRRDAPVEGLDDDRRETRSVLAR